MMEWVADYRVLRALDDPAAPGRRYLASPPERLGLGGEPVLVEVGPGEPADLLPELERWAAAAARAAGGLVTPLEVAMLDGGSGAAGTPLAWLSRLADTDERTVADPVAVVAGAAGGLAALHQEGGIHGAISAGRMLTTPDGGTLDLPPLSGPRPPGLVVRVAATGQLDGVAPELARGAPPTAASDVWALGACLHHAVTGQRVHPGLDGDLLLAAVQRAAFEPATIAAGRLSELLSGCCDPDPAARPSAGEVAAALGDLARGRR